MSKSNHSIVILEPSVIVYEGIVSVLLNSGIHYHISKVDSFEELLEYTDTYDILLINPVYIQQNIDVFQKQIAQLPMYTIALLYALYPQSITTLCKAVIHIGDSAEQILQTIEKECVEGHHAKLEVDKELLSDREVQVIKQLVKGLSNKEIADALCISTHTVISHRKNITQKTGIKSQAGLTIYALSNNIITLDSIQ